VHKAMLIGLVVFVFASAGLIIAQLWFPVVSWDNYIKLIFTFGIVALVLGFLIIIKADFGEKKKLKDENYLD